MPRKIIHIDMDCFFAAVELRDRPELVGKPVAVRLLGVGVRFADQTHEEWIQMMLKWPQGQLDGA